MTDNEIIKALDCCSNASWSSCHDCPYREKQFQNHCAFTMSGDALALINRQQAEIERLTKCRKEEVEKLMSAIDEVVTEAKSEAIKEFAERLITTFNDMECQAKTTRKTVRVEELIDQANWIIHTVAIETIDKVKREMEGEQG